MHRALLFAALSIGCSPSDGDGPSDAAACVAMDAGSAEGGAVVTRAEVDDIIKNSCAFSTCHGKKPGAGGLYLPAPPDNWVVQVVNVPSTVHKTMKRVAPGDPANSFLLQKLGPGLCALAKDCVGGSCGDRMPQTSTPLPDDEIARVAEWIRQGASDK